MGLRISATEKFFLSPKAIDQRFTKGLNIKMFSKSLIDRNRFKKNNKDSRYIHLRRRSFIEKP
jgi:hypothetical protein